MRIRLIQKPRPGCMESIDVDRFRVGMEYEVGNTIGALFLIEKWAVPVASDEPAVLIPISQLPVAYKATANDASRKRARRSKKR